MADLRSAPAICPGRVQTYGGLPNRQRGHRARAEGGIYLQLRAQFAESRHALERALAISDKVLGPDHPETAGSLDSLGSLLRAQGDLAAARPYLERALAIREKAFGPDHPDTASSLALFGALLNAQGDPAAARPERALAIREKALGPDHPHTLLVRRNLETISD